MQPLRVGEKIPTAMIIRRFFKQYLDYTFVISHEPLPTSLDDWYNRSRRDMRIFGKRTRYSAHGCLVTGEKHRGVVSEILCMWTVASG